MKITTEKSQPVKLHDWLKVKKLSLKELIVKKMFKTYGDLIQFCDKINIIPCSESDFSKVFLELYPPQPPETVKEIDENQVEHQLEKQEIEVQPQKQHSKKK